MGSFEISGGKKLQGEITPQGAKNEALQVLCATLLSPEKITIRNIPMIQDVLNLMKLLGLLGVEIKQLGDHDFSFRAKNIDLSTLESEKFLKLASTIRGSVMILGPLLARSGFGILPKPGGDKIGRRRLDTHFKGLVELGAEFTFDADQNLYRIHGKKLKGKHILLEEASVTGTANVIMASVFAQGTTSIYNAACEPYVQQLSRMLNKMGAKISGIGSNLLKIKGIQKLGGCEHILLPDMIEIGSFMGMAALTNSEILIKNVSYENLGMIPDHFKKLGIRFEKQNDDIYIPSQDHYEIESFIDGSILTISDGIWPSLTPDLLSVFLVTATQAKGSVLIHQKMFESRLFFVDKLIDMGAQIILCDPHRATIIGLDNQFPLRGTTMTSPDIRAGVALLIAALSASGRSTIHNIEQIDRGYQKIDERLRAIGAEIKRL